MDPFSEQRPDVIVIGAGILGLTCARALADRGHSVAVLERQRPGGGASYAAAGMLAPLAEVPEQGPFFRACRDSRDMWRAYAAELSAETGMDLDHNTQGTVLVDEPAVLSCFQAAATSLGEPVEQLDRAALDSLLPNLARHHRSGLLLSGEHRIDNRLVCSALELALARRGVSVHGGRGVRTIRSGVGSNAQGVVVEGDGWRSEAGSAIVTAGAWSGQISIHGGDQRARDAGDIDHDPLPVRPVRGEMLSYGDIAWPFSGCVRSAHCYAARRAGGGLLVGATVDEVGFDDRTTARGQRELLDGIGKLFPRLAERTALTSWSGLRPGTPDGLPYVGPVGGDAIWAATGHYRNGILLAPWTAHWLVRAMEGNTTARRTLAPFSPARVGSPRGVRS